MGLPGGHSEVKPADDAARRALEAVRAALEAARGAGPFERLDAVEYTSQVVAGTWIRASPRLPRRLCTVEDVQTGTNEYLVAGIFVPLPHENALPSLHANSGPPRFGLTEEESKL
eukprot:PRCOL_00003557-RA